MKMGVNSFAEHCEKALQMMAVLDHELPDGARRVQLFLINSGSQARVCLLPGTTATAQDAANALGVPVSQIGKSIVFGTEPGIVVAVVCGNQRVDSVALACALGKKRVVPLRADDVKRYTGYVIGGVSPFGLASEIQIIVDADLRSLQTCYVAAGHPKAVVRIDLDDLVTITEAKVSPIAISP